MLIKLVEWLSKNKTLYIPHVGTVVDNADPDKKGRIKVTIPELLTGNTDDLPWMYPYNYYALGGKASTLQFIVPEVNSLVTVVFPFHDIYLGFYNGSMISDTFHNSLFDENYPESYGWIDSIGNYWKVNKETMQINLHHQSGTHVLIDADGTITVTGVVDLNVNIINNVTNTVGVDQSETVGGNDTKSITGNKSKTVSGNETQNVSGDQTVDVGGNISITSGGKIDITAAGNITLKGAQVLLNP